jgi:hypothetical protein
MTATYPSRTAVTTCVVPGKPHMADSGIHLCRTHFDELSEWLYDVEREYDALDARPSMAANWGGARGGKLASHTTPARINPLVHNDPRHVPLSKLTHLSGADDTLSAYDVLHTTANRIRNDRGIHLPGRWVVDRISGRIGPYHDECTHGSCGLMRWRHFVPDVMTVASERRFLSRHLEWAASQPWIDDLYAEIRRLRGQLQAVNGTGDLRVGACPKCRGRLAIQKPKHTSGTPTPTDTYWAAECDRDPLHRWEGKQLIKLRLELDEQQGSVK